MRSNFHLKTRQENQTLHIQLHGTFDGASAFELIRTIADREKRVELIHVDTSYLALTLPFGKSVLDSHLPKTGLRPRLHFSGALAEKILPEGCILLAKSGDQGGHKCRGNCKQCTCRQGRRRLTPSGH